MTAEVCVMNTLGVALAADSAVTRTGTGDPKIYQSADKLFLLSHTDPIAMMIYGAAAFMGVPWETIIKQYRRLHGHKTHGTVLAHATAFRRFLTKDRTLFPEDIQGAFLVLDAQGFANLLLGRLRKVIESEIATAGKITEERIKAIATQMIADELKAYRGAKTPVELPQTHVSAIQKLFGKDIANATDKSWHDVPLNKAVRGRLCSLIAEMCVKGASPGYSGVVVAGFGRAEVFPSTVSFVTFRIQLNRLKYKKGPDGKVGQYNSATIIPFAQSEMVQTFMDGIDPGLQVYVEESLRKTFEDLPDKFVDALDATPRTQKRLRGTLRDLSKKALENLHADWLQYQTKHQSGPIIQVVGILPKDELASLAESLVNLTVLRRHTSPEAETVGGPIDVAVIIKGDGFVWIKRKHYFDPKLNPRYIRSLGTGAT